MSEPPPIAGQSPCGHENPPQAKFCLQCGSWLGHGPLPPSPSSYTPPHLAQRIASSRGALEGERKQITVLFADLKGSMEILADRDPEEARTILDPVLERMMEAVHTFEGTVNQVMGDGIMALFGAPVAHEDHAVRACYAALRMQESVRRFAEEARRTEKIDVRIRVGLNSGEVVVRSISGDLRMDYAAVGETTHLAARMEQSATPGTIRLTTETLRLAQGAVAVRRLGRIAVKGLSHRVETYEAIGPGSTRTRFQAAAARGLARFVGREAELGRLREALAQAGDGRGQIVAVVGEPGVGKSRLLHELAHPRRAEGWLVLESSAASYGQATSYFPIIELLHSYFSVSHQDDHAVIREKVASKMVALDPSLEPSVTPLVALLDVPLEGEWKGLDPAERRQRTLAALTALLLRVAKATPLVLICEDLQWLDAETQTLLDRLVEQLSSANLLLLVSYRPEYEDGWQSNAAYTQIRLDPLPEKSAEELLASLLGDDPQVEPVKRMLMDRAGGNPLFLEECVRSLAEDGVLAGERGAYRLERAPDLLAVPATVQAILASRIDRLSPEEKRLLQTAAVIGEEVPFALLHAVTGTAEQELRASLAHLQAAGFLFEATLFPDLELAFKHALTHDVAYHGVLKERRRALHADIVAGIETLYAARLAEHTERLAHHAIHGELWDKAVSHSQRSARKAAARSAFREAAACYEQALRALAHLPDDRKVLERAVDLRFEMTFMLAPLGETTRAIAVLGEAVPLAEKLEDPHRLARVLAQTGICLWAGGRADRALESGRRAFEIALRLDDASSKIIASYLLGNVHNTIGEYAEAIDVLAAGLRMLEAQQFSSRFRTFYSVALRVGSALALAPLGRLPEALAAASEALRIAEAEGDSHDLSTAYGAAGFVEFQRGEFEAAIRLLEHGREICERAGLKVTQTVTAADLGRTYAFSGRAEAGRQLLERALQRAGDEIQVFAGHWQTYLGEACLRTGDAREAQSIASRALDLSRERGQRGAEAECLHLLGEIASSLAPADLAEARACHREATARAEELGMRPLVARCHLSLGEIERKAGDRTASLRHLEVAASLFRKMEMRYWLGRAEAAARAAG